MSLTIYHNPRCRKSREAVQYLNEIGKAFEIVKYLEQPFDRDTLKEVLNKINKKPSEILRKNETLWKKEFSSKQWSEEEVLDLLISHPKLIERPIVTDTKSGVLARPLENLVEFIQQP
jgi:arsenate reductase